MTQSAFSVICACRVCSQICRILPKFWADQNVMFDWTADITGTGDRSEYIGPSRKCLESLEEVVNKDTDKEAQVPASVFIIADC